VPTNLWRRSRPPIQWCRFRATKFLTAKLWDVGNSAPFGHRGDLDTIYAAIVAHGGEATASEAEFEALPNSDQAAVVVFLKSLMMPIINHKDPNPQMVGSPTF